MYAKLGKLVLTENLRLLAVDNTKNESLFYVSGSSKFFRDKLYVAKGSLNKRPRLLYRFKANIELFLVSPFGYFIALAPYIGCKKWTIMRSLDFGEWDLVYTLHLEGNTTYDRGWEYAYNEKDKKGMLFINEKNNSFPIPAAYISKGVFYGGKKACTLKHNTLYRKDTPDGILSIVYEFPNQSAKVSIRDNGSKLGFVCKKSHRSSTESEPKTGKAWEEYWEETEPLDEFEAWEEKQIYLSIKDRKRIRHLHNIDKDPFSDLIIIGTGDFDDEPALFFSMDFLSQNPETGLVKLNEIGSGSQKWRTVSVEFTPQYLYWAMDSQYDAQKIFRIKRSELLKHNGTRIDEDKLELVANVPDKSFLASYCYKDGDGYKIIFSSGYEVSKYNVDRCARVFCVQERADGSFSFAEIASFPAKANSFGKLYPIGVDKDGFLYFNTVSLETMPTSQILKVKID